MKKIISVGLLAVLALGALGVGLTTSAQTTLMCSTSASSVPVNENITLTATGGTGGDYTWSGQGLTATNTTGSQFVVSYNTMGTYTVTVSRGTATANCIVNVVAGTTSTTSTTLTCTPAVQGATMGQTASFSASGGNGTYTWSSPDLNIVNPSGSGFSANFASTGTKSVTVHSGNEAATCVVNVTGTFTPTPTPTPTPIPGFPNTGGGYGR